MIPTSSQYKLCRISKIERAEASHHMIKMLFTVLSRMFRQSKSEKIFLGRWGYHWETYKHIQKYYE
jgi:hypothetical protein